MDTDSDFSFAEEQALDDSSNKSAWKILIVDDDKDMHTVTMLAFANFKFQDRPVTFLNAYSSAQASDLLNEHHDIALILLDVVMETDDAGLKLVHYLRGTVKNKLVRIILRTGQPGYAPERSVILEYDINDYKEKTELTANKLFTAIVVGLRTYQDLIQLEEHRKKIIEHAEAATRFVPQGFLKLLNKDSISNLKLGDCVKQKMSVFFLDVRSFTSLSEQLSPEENFNFINSFLSFLEPAVVKYEGFVDKYIGDSIMALFCRSSDAAVRAGIEMQLALDKFNQQPSSGSKFKINAGVGINTGMLIMGTIGFHNRMECTVISDVVNTSSRIEKLTKKYGARLLISETTLNDMENARVFNIRYLANEQIIGKKTSIKIYEVFDVDEDHIIALKNQTKALFEEAVHLCEQENFLPASKKFDEIVCLNEHDQPARFYLKKCLDRMSYQTDRRRQS